VSKASASTSRRAPAGSAVPTPAKPKRTSKRKRPVVPEAPGRARIIAIANQKGGVGKSTTAVSLGAALADIGYRVLVADLDPQGNASTGMGIRHDARDVTVYDVVVSEAEIERAIVPTPVERLHAIPATIDLAGAEIELVSQFSRESRLKKAIEPVREGVYDFILLDCPPSLGLLTINALTAAEELIVPIQCEYYALEGLGQLLRNVSLVQQNINSGLRLSGIVMTMFDPRTKLSEQVVHEVQRYFGGLVYDVIIPRTVRLSEAPGFGQPITVYDAKSKGAEAYRQLAREVALRPPPEAPMPTFDDIPVQMTVEPGAAAPAAAAVSRETSVEPDVVEAPEADGPADETAAVDEPEPFEVDAPSEPDQADDLGDESAPEADVVDVAEEPAPEPEVVDMAGEPQPTGSAPSAEDELWEEAQPEPEARVKPLSRPSTPGELPERRVVVLDDHPDIDIEAGKEAPPPPPGAPEHGMADIGETLDDDKGRKRRWRMFRKGGDR
jgi:chromosome partitioning protein